MGDLIASLIVPRLARRLGPARITLLGLPLSAGAAAATALSTNWLMAMVLLLVMGAAYLVVVLNSIIYRQQVTPNALMSRVNTTGRMLAWGLGIPVGSLLGGIVAEVAGPRAGMLAGVMVCSLGVLVAWTSPLRAEAAAHSRGAEN